MKWDQKSKIDKTMFEKKYKSAKKLLLSALRQEPDNPWLLTELSALYYQQHKDKKALEISKKAYRIAPNHPIVLWDYANALDASGHQKKAINIYKKILYSRVKSAVLQEYPRGRKWAGSLTNDCRYAIGLCYIAMGTDISAIKWLNKYIKNYGEGKGSLWTLDKARSKLNSLKNRKLIGELYDKEDWTQAQRLTVNELKKKPNDVWLLTILSSCYYEQHQYKKALQIIQKAYRLSPNDPLVIWHFGGALSMLNRHLAAATKFKQILRKGVKRVGFVDTTEGIRWARSLINDCRYRIALCYYDMGKKPLAIRYMKQHLANRSTKTPSIYPIKKAQTKFKEIMAA